ncbi:uncharacterized protein VTP21DRAFT_11609 [Calcarisporiella thermophila]|uniref:uncharacterized protein n=1 Tax=Calcarisporiella thermophila TaxID=911321 RepID=UPI003743BDE5
MRYNEADIINFSLSPFHIDKSGFLLKRGEANSFSWKLATDDTFKQRWCVLKGNILFYFAEKNTQPLGFIFLENHFVTSLDNDPSAPPHSFALCFSNDSSHDYVFSAPNEETRQQWIEAIQYASIEHPREHLRHLVDELQDTEKKLSASQKNVRKLRDEIRRLKKQLHVQEIEFQQQVEEYRQQHEVILEKSIAKDLSFSKDLDALPSPPLSKPVKTLSMSSAHSLSTNATTTSNSTGAGILGSKSTTSRRSKSRRFSTSVGSVTSSVSSESQKLNKLEQQQPSALKIGDIYELSFGCSFPGSTSTLPAEIFVVMSDCHGSWLELGKTECVAIPKAESNQERAVRFYICLSVVVPDNPSQDILLQFALKYPLANTSADPECFGMVKCKLSTLVAGSRGIWGTRPFELEVLKASSGNIQDVSEVVGRLTVRTRKARVPPSYRDPILPPPCPDPLIQTYFAKTSNDSFLKIFELSTESPFNIAVPQLLLKAYIADERTFLLRLEAIDTSNAPSSIKPKLEQAKQRQMEVHRQMIGYYTEIAKEIGREAKKRWTTSRTLLHRREGDKSDGSAWEQLVCRVREMDVQDDDGTFKNYRTTHFEIPRNFVDVVVNTKSSNVKPGPLAPFFEVRRAIETYASDLTVIWTGLEQCILSLEKFKYTDTKQIATATKEVSFYVQEIIKILHSILKDARLPPHHDYVSEFDALIERVTVNALPSVEVHTRILCDIGCYQDVSPAQPVPELEVARRDMKTSLREMAESVRLLYSRAVSLLDYHLLLADMRQMSSPNWAEERRNRDAAFAHILCALTTEFTWMALAFCKGKDCESMKIGAQECRRHWDQLMQVGYFAYIEVVLGGMGVEHRRNNKSLRDLVTAVEDIRDSVRFKFHLLSPENVTTREEFETYLSPPTLQICGSPGAIQVSIGLTAMQMTLLPDPLQRGGSLSVHPALFVKDKPVKRVSTAILGGLNLHSVVTDSLSINCNGIRAIRSYVERYKIWVKQWHAIQVHSSTRVNSSSSVVEVAPCSVRDSDWKSYLTNFDSMLDKLDASLSGRKSSKSKPEELIGQLERIVRMLGQPPDKDLPLCSTSILQVFLTGEDMVLPTVTTDQMRILLEGHQLDSSQAPMLLQAMKEEESRKARLLARLC